MTTLNRNHTIPIATVAQEPVPVTVASPPFEVYLLEKGGTLAVLVFLFLIVWKTLGLDKYMTEAIEAQRANARALKALGDTLPKLEEHLERQGQQLNRLTERIERAMLLCRIKTGKEDTSDY